MKSAGISDVLRSATPPDSVSTLYGSSAGKVVTADYPAGAQLMRVSAQVGAFVNYASTGANVAAASMSASTKSTTKQEFIGAGFDREFQIPGNSTGFSVAFTGAGALTFGFWNK